MKLKNKILGLLLMLLCVGTSFASAESVIGSIENNDTVITGKYDTIVKEYALQQANCIDNGVKFVADENASEELNDYLRIQETTREIYLKKEKYTAAAEILEKEIIEDVIYYKVNVKQYEFVLKTKDYLLNK